jgi:hypothetical protein
LVQLTHHPALVNTKPVASSESNCRSRASLSWPRFPAPVSRCTTRALLQPPARLRLLLPSTTVQPCKSHLRCSLRCACPKLRCRRRSQLPIQANQFPVHYRLHVLPNYINEAATSSQARRSPHPLLRIQIKLQVSNMCPH